MEKKTTVEKIHSSTEKHTISEIKEKKEVIVLVKLRMLIFLQFLQKQTNKKTQQLHLFKAD